MAERPILFSGPMVRAILSGGKTQTRRVVTTPRWAAPGTLGCDETGCEADARVSGCTADVLCPFGAPGDTLWVRETWQTCTTPEDRDLSMVRYAADGPVDCEGDRWTWRPSIHMPRWASRLTLAVTSVRVERLHAITDADVKAEGIAGWSKDRALYKFAPADHEGDGPCWPWADCPHSPREGFAKLWDELAPEGVRWGDDPWVWVVSFERVEVTP